MGNPKRLPMSDRAIEISNRYLLKYIYGVLDRQLGTDWVDGKTMSLTESASTIHTLKCGSTFGAVSVKTVLQFRLYLQMLFTSPDEATFPKPDTNTRYLHARFGLMDKGATNVGASFFSFYHELLRYIEKNWRIRRNVPTDHDTNAPSLHPRCTLSRFWGAFSAFWVVI